MVKYASQFKSVEDGSFLARVGEEDFIREEAGRNNPTVPKDSRYSFDDEGSAKCVNKRLNTTHFQKCGTPLLLLSSTWWLPFFIDT